MSKIRLNPNLKTFLKRNKPRIMALVGVALVIGAVVDKINKQNEVSVSATTSISNEEKESLLRLKERIENNIDNVRVIKDEEKMEYHIMEEFYIPEEDKDNKVHSKKNDTNEFLLHTISSTITYKEAEEIDIVELLESKSDYAKSKSKF